MSTITLTGTFDIIKDGKLTGDTVEITTAPSGHATVDPSNPDHEASELVWDDVAVLIKDMRIRRRS